MDYFLIVLILVELTIIGFILFIKILKRNKILKSIKEKYKTLIELRKAVKEGVNSIEEQRDIISELQDKSVVLKKELRLKVEYLNKLKSKERNDISDNN